MVSGLTAVSAAATATEPAGAQSVQHIGGGYGAQPYGAAGYGGSETTT